MNFVAFWATSLLLASGRAQPPALESSAHMYAHLLAQWAGVLANDPKVALDELRRRGESPAYDPKWCVQQGVVPREWRQKKGNDA